MHSLPPTDEHYFRILFEACGEAFFVCNEQGQAIDCNDAAHLLLACQRYDILGTTPLDWSPEWQPNGRRSDEWAAELFSRATEGETVRFEWENRRLDRTPVFVSVTLRRAIIDRQTCYLVVSRDVSERKLAEAALQASERRFSQLIQNSYDAFVILDADGIQRYVSPSAERVHGYAPAELVDIPVIERMIHPEDQAQVQESFRRIIETGSGGAQYRHRNKAGGWVHLEAFGTNQLSNPDIHGVVINVRDITEKKKAESAFHAIEQRLRKTLEQSPNVAVQWYDLDGCVRYWNPASEQLYGYSAAEAIGRTLDQLIHTPEEAEAFRQTLIGIAASGETIGPAHYKTHDRYGAERVVLATIFSIPGDEPGNPLFVCMDIDVTEEKRNAALLERQAAFNRAIIDSEVDGIAVCHAIDASPHIVFSVWNPAMEELTGYSMQEINRLGWYQTVHIDPALQELARERMGRMHQGDHLCAEEWIITRKDGEKRTVQISTAMVGDSDGVPTVLAIMHDITKRKKADEALYQSRRMFHLAFESCPIPASIASARDGRFVEVNANYQRDFGWTREELIGRTSLEIKLWPTQQTRNDWIKAMKESPRLIGYETAWMHKDGSLRQVSISSEITELDGNPCILAYVIDITERKRSEAAREEATALLQAAIEQSPSGILVADAPDARIRLANTAALGIRGGESRMLTGIELQQHALRWQILKPDGSPCPSEEFPLSRAVLKGETVKGEEYIIRDETGNEHWISANAAPIRRNGELVAGIVIFHDISLLKAHERQLDRLAHHDTLTGLPNRVLLIDRMRQAMAQARRNGRRTGIVLLDLDGFKWINDSVGHDTGDAVLVTIARRFEGSLRAQDTVARLGGDEFVLVIQDVQDVDDVLRITEKALVQLREPIDVGGRAYHVSGSAGMTLYPDDGDDEQILIRNADVAMYRAKAAGKNRAQFYAAQMQSEALLRMETVAGLRQSLVAEEFSLHYQPLVDAVTGDIEGAEALIRWNHPQHGMVSPAEFIPIAEESGLIVPIGEWVLREALQQMRTWEDSGMRLPRVAINVSALQFRETGLCEMVSNALVEFGLTPERLTIEITESVLMDENPVTTASINGLEILGVQLALDDFGTGYSSLSALKRFPVDYVKIDRSFIRDCIDDKEDANLVKAIIQMAQGLNLTVVAEGVETQDQADFLSAQGCAYLQGYLISKPLPTSAFKDFLAKRPQA